MHKVIDRKRKTEQEEEKMQPIKLRLVAPVGEGTLGIKRCVLKYIGVQTQAARYTALLTTVCFSQVATG